jgi:hypothetical protein
MDWIIVLSAALSAVATALGITMRARYRYLSIVAIVDAWRSDRNLDLPATIEALQARRPTPPGIQRSPDSPP